MEKLKIMTIVFLFTFGLLNTVAAAKPASVMLREGLYAEEVEGDIDAAIKIYEQIIQDSSASRKNVAQALYRQGMCYLKKKDEQKAKAVFGKLLAKYSDQTEIIERAKPYLDDLMNYDPAELMPPETLIYVELGRPGKQIETILNMLKGTFLENPLAVIGGPGGPAGPDGKSAEDMLAALLNPSMMAEFKKIRGMAVGITAIRGNNPAGVAVLYTAKSDELRGIILVGLGIAGQRGEPIQGMESLNIQNKVSVAYDDKVIIIAQPAEQLEWCVKQYKGTISEATLALSNKSFAKVGKKTRQDSALTIWANVDEVYTGVLKQFPAEQIPKEMLWANALVDFNSIDDLIMSYSIEESGFVCKADVSFKDGHHCLVYDMFRTPNLNKAALEAVPSDAIAIVSMALAQADGAQAKAVGKKIQKVTGLDIGREIFANVEQVILFAMPSDKTAISDVPFLANIGLAMTSHNPKQTRQIITMLLGTANLMTGGQQADQTNVSSGRYQIGIVGDQKLYCYMNQVNKTTVLSLNKDITDACIAAIKQGKSACTAGPLKDSISKISPATSKLALVNVGGAIRVATPAIIGSFGNSHRERIQRALEQLNKSCSRTTIEFRTDERLNSFTEYAAITGLPPINEVVGPVTEISQVISQVKAEARAEKLREAVHATIFSTTKIPVIDGMAEDIWSSARQYKIGNVIYSPVASANDLSADYRAMWDQENLYLFVDVRDDMLKNDSGEYYYDDAIEVFIDADNSKASEYGEHVYQYYFDWDKTKPSIGLEGQPYSKEDVKFALVTTDNGYRLEVKFPWSTLGTKPSAGVKIGLDVHVDDDDDGGERDSKLTWQDKKDTAWQNPQVFGTAELAGLIGWWKFDENEGSTAADSSGNGNDGLLQGDPVWQPDLGKFAGALAFDGSGDYVKIDNESKFDITSQITISAWVNITSVPAEWTAIVTKGDSAWRLSTEYANRGFHFAVSGSAWLNGQRSVSANQWHHVVGVYDGSQIRTYIDGELDVSRAWNEGISSNDYPVYIGGNAEQTGRFWHGLIDDVRIYNYALKEADIIALYNESVSK